MVVTTEAIRALREETGAGIMDCKRALTEASGDAERAKVLLRERGYDAAAKRAERETAQGVVEAYIHPGGRIGVLLELNCETDFVARTAEFRTLAHELAMQVAAMNPRFVTPEEIPTVLPQREGMADEQAMRLALASQDYIRDPSRRVSDVIRDIIAQTGENVRVRRFVRFELGK